MGGAAVNGKKRGSGVAQGGGRAGARVGGFAGARTEAMIGAFAGTLACAAWVFAPGALSAQAAGEDTFLVAETTGTSVWLRWSLPDTGFPDAGFLIERRDAAGALQEFRVASPLSRSDAVGRGLIGDAEYSEFVATFSPAPGASPEEADTRAFNRAMITLGTFTRPEWARVLGTLFEDTDVTPGATYAYRVTATFSGRNVLLGEDEVTVGEPDPLPVLTGLEGEPDEEGVRLRWDLPEEGFIVAFQVFRTGPDGAERNLTEHGLFVSQRPDPETGALVPPDVFLHDTEVEINTTYEYSVAGVNVVGRETARSEPVSIFFPDPDPLEVPGVTGVDVRDRAIELFWPLPADERIEGVGVVRTLDPLEDGVLLTPELLPPSTTSFVDTTVEGGVSYYYSLVAEDRYGQRFGPGSWWATRGVNLSAPSAPTALTLTPTEESLVLTWEAPPEPDVHGYQVALVRDGDEETFVLATDRFVTETRYTLPVPPGTLDELRVAVRAVNTSFVEGPYSEPAVGRIIDTVPPDRPILREVHAGEGLVSLSWAFTSDPDVVEYRVLRSVQGEEGFRLLREGLSPDETSLEDRDVVPGLLHVYTVEALDASGNVSEQAAPLAATPYRLARPDAPGSPAARLLDEGGVEVRWEAPSAPGILFYVVERLARSGRWVQVGDPLLAEHLGFVDSTGGEGHSYRVIAVDTGGNRSEPSVEARVGR